MPSPACPNCFVIGSNSAFTYKNRAVDARQVGSELGVPTGEGVPIGDTCHRDPWRTFSPLPKTISDHRSRLYHLLFGALQDECGDVGANGTRRIRDGELIARYVVEGASVSLRNGFPGSAELRGEVVELCQAILHRQHRLPVVHVNARDELQ